METDKEEEVTMDLVAQVRPPGAIEEHRVGYVVRGPDDELPMCQWLSETDEDGGALNRRNGSSCSYGLPRCLHRSDLAIRITSPSPSGTETLDEEQPAPGLFRSDGLSEVLRTANVLL